MNKRWLHFNRFARDMSLDAKELSKIVLKAPIGKTITVGRHHLCVDKNVKDRYGPLYTLSLMNENDKLLRRGPIYISKPHYHRLISEALTVIMLMVLAVASVVIVAMFVSEVGEIAIIQESCKIASLEVIATGPNLGFMRIVIQNDSDQDTVDVTIADPLGDVKFDDGSNSTPPRLTTPLPESKYEIPNDYYTVLPARGTIDIGERISTSHKQGESVLLQVEVNYGSHTLTCTAGATIR